MRLTPSEAASGIERRRPSAWGSLTWRSAWSGLPLQLSAVSATPLSAKMPRYSSIAPRSPASTASGMCTGGRNPPELISALSSPMPARIPTASSTGLSCRHAVYAPNLTRSLPFVGLSVSGEAGGAGAGHEVDVDGPAALHGLPRRLAHRGRRIAVPGAGARGGRLGGGGDPGLQLGGVGGREALLKAHRDAPALGPLGAQDGARRGLQPQDAGLADDLAADVVAVAGVDERLDVHVHAALAREQHDQRVLRAGSGPAGDAWPDGGRLDELLAEQPADGVDIVHDRVLDDHLRPEG